MKSSGVDSSNHDYSEEELIGVLLKQLSDPRDDFNIFAIRELKHYHTPKVVEELAAIIQTDSKNEKKLEAIKSLKSRKPNEYVKNIIIEQLASPSEDIRSEAAEFLKEYGEVIEKDIRTFLKQEIPMYSKEKAIWLLGQVGEKDTIDFLENIKQSKNKELEDIITDSIGLIKTRNVRLLLDDLKKNVE